MENNEKSKNVIRHRYQDYKDCDLSGLTEEEKQFLLLKLSGKNTREIAEITNTKPSFVQIRLTNTLRKLDGKERYDIEYRRKKREKKEEVLGYSIKNAIRHRYQDYKDCDLSGLTEEEKQFLLLKLSGKNTREIAEITNTNRSIVQIRLTNALRKLDGKERYDIEYRCKKREKKEEVLGYSIKRNRHDYSKYIDCDLSLITDRQREAFELKIKGLTSSEIAKRLGTSVSCACNLIHNARCTLDGEELYLHKYYNKNKKEILQKKTLKNQKKQ